MSADAATVDAKPELSTPFHKLGGRPTFAAIAARFYDLMEHDPAYAELRAMHAPDLARMRESLAGFLAGWSGGPRDWFEANPGKCMVSMHKPFPIGTKVAGQWAEAMTRAIEETPSADPELGKAMAGVLRDLALGMARR